MARAWSPLTQRRRSRLTIRWPVSPNPSRASDSGEAIARYGDSEDAVPTISVVPNASSHTPVRIRTGGAVSAEQVPSSVATAPQASHSATGAVPRVHRPCRRVGRRSSRTDPRLAGELPHIPGAHEDIDQWNSSKPAFDLSKLVAPLQENLKYLNVVKGGIEKGYDYIRRDFYTSLVASIGTS